MLILSLCNQKSDDVDKFFRYISTIQLRILYICDQPIVLLVLKGRFWD